MNFNNIKNNKYIQINQTCIQFRFVETQCAPGWRLFRNKCIALYEGIDAVDACNMSNTAAVSFFNKTELEEYMYLFPITGTRKFIFFTGNIDICSKSM